MFVGPAEKTFQRAIDQSRIFLRKIIVTAAETLHGSGREIFHNDVGFFRQPIQQLPSVVIFQIDCEAAFVAVECGKEAGAETYEAASRITIGWLDLDHVGSKIGEDHTSGRPHNGVTEFEHADAGKGESSGGSFSLAHAGALSTSPRRAGRGRVSEANEGEGACPRFSSPQSSPHTRAEGG